MKRLLCILASLNTGGAETFMMKVFRALPYDYKIDFVVSADSGYYESEVEELGGRIFRVSLRKRHPIRTFFEIAKVVRENRYNYVLKMADTPVALYDLLSARIGGAKVLCVRSCNSSSRSGCLEKVLYKCLQPVLNYFTDVKLAPSLLAAKFTFGEKAVEHGDVHIINNALDTEIYRFDKKLRYQIRNEFDIDDDAVLFGHIGRFTFQKNHEFLIDVFYEVLKEVPKAKLMLVGSGELLENIKNKVRELGIYENVIFAGIRSDISAILSAMDMLLLPSYFEGMPNVVLEAQSTGLKCIISDTITKEAAITDLVKYCPINKIPCSWTNKIKESTSIKIRRERYHALMKQHGYDIHDNVQLLTNLIFGVQ